MPDATECGRLANVQREQARVASGLTWIAKSRRLFSAIFGPDHVHHVQADVGKCRTRPGETPLAPDSARMGQVVTCHCGAAFERTETLLIFWVMDDFLCSECGEVLESWNGPRVPIYALIQRPGGSASKAPQFSSRQRVDGSAAAHHEDRRRGRSVARRSEQSAASDELAGADKDLLTIAHRTNTQAGQR